MSMRASLRHGLRTAVLFGPMVAALGGPAAAAGADYKLGYSAGWLTDPFQAVQVRSAMEQATKEGLTVLPPANANQDASKQISDFHNLIALGAQGILVNPTDSQAIVPALAFAAERKIPVVAIDTAPSGGKVAMIVRADNTRMGEQACKAIGDGLKGKGTVLSLMGDQASTNGRDRTDGFNKCMQTYYPGIKVVQRPTNWKADLAASTAQTIVTSTPDLSAIYLQSDAVMLAGVLNVLSGQNKLHKVGEPGHIFVASIDGTPAALKRLREGDIDTVISQPLNLYVKYGVADILDAMKGQTFKVGPTDHDSRIVDLNGNPMDLLPAPVVTKADADDPNLWGNQAK